jgi:SAM-dependent methyltransferase
MTMSVSQAAYLLGDTKTEHERLVTQASVLDPITERVFRDAGIGPGRRVLDIGSGVGDVAMLAAKLVGPSGAVVGVEREATTIAKARARVAAAGLSNVNFVLGDVAGVESAETFDAVVGRLILEYIPHTGAVLRSLSTLLRPGGVVVFQDACWGPLLQLSAHLPLRSKCASLIYRAFELSGAHMNMEFVLYRAIQECGLPAPNMRVEVPVGNEPDVVHWVYDIFCTLLPRMPSDEFKDKGIGDLETLKSRLEAERTAANSFGACVGLVSAWSRKPENGF